MPVVALATTELPTVIEDGRTGFMSTDPGALVERARELFADPMLARRLGAAGQAVARERFSIERFGRDWDRVLREAAGHDGRGPRGGGLIRAPLQPRRRRMEGVPAA
jgi:glycosyltransferase involved in cell wall biosynthesis